jgi:hypothetical protein
MDLSVRNKIDVTPNPRILQMLGEIAFEPWQCLAELIDNSLDAYISAIQRNADWLSEVDLEKYKIDVQLPNKNQFDQGTGTVRVGDSGPGMTLEQLANAVRAGFSGNAPLEKLGLFGMGFNIATARLGRITRVRTSRRVDDRWLVLELDLDQMQKSGQFNASITYESKDDSLQHGTVIEISRLKGEFKGQLTSGPGRNAISKQLARIYSAILDEQKVELEFCEKEVEPWRHCVWAEGRTALGSSGTHIPAFIKINHRLPDYYFCDVCWHWSSPSSVKNEHECPACGATGSIALKPREIRGWLGIQRYFDQSHYGIDFVRNGRVIEQLNKDCFTWTGDGDRELEYPIDTAYWGGRIVGQINVNFAQVDYQKTAFSKNRTEWLEVIEYLRGDAPLRPQIAAERNYGVNNSPVSQLYQAFRSGRTSGRKMLVPGKSDAPTVGDNADAIKWAEYFYEGRPEFQTDDAWWERVEKAENARRGKAPTPPSGVPAPHDSPGSLQSPEVDLENPFDDSGVTDEPKQEAIDADDQRELDTELTGKYRLSDPSTNMPPVEINVYKDTRYLRPRDLRNSPPFDVDSRKAPHAYLYTYHPKHPAFTEYKETVVDYLLLELAHGFSTRLGGGAWTAGRVYKALKDEYASGQKLDLVSLGESAHELLAELKEHLSDCKLKKSRGDVPKKLLDELSEDVMTAEGDISIVDSLLESGRWIERVNDEFMIPVVENFPELIMDGKFFKTSHAAVAQETIRQEALDRIVSSIKDAISIKKASDRRSTPDKSLLMRANASITYLYQQRA